MKLKSSLNLLLTFLLFSLAFSCQQGKAPETIDISQEWRFSPDSDNRGMTNNWQEIDFDDSGWITLNAGTRWEEQGFPELDGYAWYRKTVNIPAEWKGKDVWVKFGAVNDAYELFIYGEQVSSFGAANITFAAKPSFTKVTGKIRYGEENLITLKVNDWGNSGGIWRLPAIITTDKKETYLFKPLSDFECRAQLPETTGNWAAFWIQSPGISSGEDPGKFGTEIDIFEYFKDQGGDFVSHNLHWAYGPNQKSTGAFLSKVDGIGKVFHTFAVEWTPEKYAFFVDGLKYYEIKEAISHIDEYIILSFEPAHSVEDLKKATLPDAYIIDYVKVYKKINQ